MKKKQLVLNPVIIMAVCLTFIICSIVFSIPLYIGFCVGITFTIAVLCKSGYSLKELILTIISGIFEVKNLIFVILFIGATTSIWLASGVVPTIMYYGFTYMEGVNFLLAAFLIMTSVSLFMGTAIGTLSTVGISLSGIGLGLGIPLNLMVGVLVSGAFIADKISPLSGLVNLEMTTLHINYRDIFKSMLVTLIPTIFITAILYGVIGSNYTSGDYSKLILYKQAIAEGFNTSPILLILPVIVLALSVSGLKSVITLSVGIVVGAILAMSFQHMPLAIVLKSIFLGYHGSTHSPELNKLLVSGGMFSMIEAIFIVISAISLVKIFEKGNVLMPLMDKLVHGINSKVSLVRRTGLISILLTVATCDQTAGIILPIKTLQNKYKELELDNTVLARTISDTGVIVAPLMPWNLNSFLIKPIFGITATQYAPYAYLCMVCPLVTIASAYILYKKPLKIHREKSV
ncbi:MAG: Na+/H+ antiporter NhaC family protein [Sedimentibacter sp.]